MDTIRSVSMSMWRSVKRYVICFSRDNIIIIFFRDRNLLLCDDCEQELGPLWAECIIYVSYCMGKWREGERQKVDSNMKE